MASVDPYATCPCGSGQKYKFCCQKVEAYAERAQRLIDSQQYEAALKPLEEGLAKVPDNPWLLTRKAMSHLHLNQMDRAKQALRVLLQAHPNHLSAWVLTTQLVVETEGPVAGVEQFQQALSACQPENRRQLAPLASFVGAALAQAGLAAAAIKHLELAVRLGAENDKQTMVALHNLRVNPAVSVWEKNPYRLALPPPNVSNEFRESFQQASGWANEGLWSAAAAAFELLSPGSSAGLVADRNRGLCCLWIADHEGAVASLGATSRGLGPRSMRSTSRPFASESTIRRSPILSSSCNWRGRFGTGTACSPRCEPTKPSMRVPAVPSIPTSRMQPNLNGFCCSIVPRLHLGRGSLRGRYHGLKEKFWSARTSLLWRLTTTDGSTASSIGSWPGQA